jgi:transcriptional regulator with XRE-family HTH domain
MNAIELQDTLALTIWQRRVLANLTGRELAQRAGIGPCQLSRIEGGRVMPSLETCVRVENALSAAEGGQRAKLAGPPPFDCIALPPGVWECLAGAVDIITLAVLGHSWLEDVRLRAKWQANYDCRDVLGPKLDEWRSMVTEAADRVWLGLLLPDALTAVAWPTPCPKRAWSAGRPEDQSEYYTTEGIELVRWKAARVEARNLLLIHRPVILELAPILLADGKVFAAAERVIAKVSEAGPLPESP